MEAYVKRGGGLVSFHDSLCGPDPAYVATLLGGAKKHGEVNYTLDAPIPYTVVDQADPIMKDMSDITILDEAFFNDDVGEAIRRSMCWRPPRFRPHAARESTRVKWCRRSGHTNTRLPEASRRARLCGCRAISTPIS